MSGVILESESNVNRRAKTSISFLPLAHRQFMDAMPYYLLHRRDSERRVEGNNTDNHEDVHLPFGGAEWTGRQGALWTMWTLAVEIHHYRHF